MKLGLYITGREYMKTFQAIRDMVEKLLPNGEIKVTTPDMQDLERTVAELRHALEVERRGHHKRWDQLEGADQTIATQKRVITELERINRTFAWHYDDCTLNTEIDSEECSCGLIEAMNKLEAIEKGKL